MIENSYRKDFFVHTQQEVDQLRQHFTSYLELKTNAITVKYDNKVYRHIASYTVDLTSSQFLKTTLLTACTFGLAYCCSESIREDWENICTGKIFSIYLEEPSTTKKVSSILQKAKLNLVSTEMIWDQAPYNEFTDLIYVPKLQQFFCCFRVSLYPQVGDNGNIQIITSPDANTWSPTTLLTLSGYDLRDPKLSLMPDGRLLLNLDATLWGPNGQETPNSAVSFSSDGIHWSPVQLLENPGEWLWRITWHKNIAYAGAYSSDANNNTTLRLMMSTDAIHYTEIKKLDIPDNPTEATFRFLPDDTMVALVRRNNGPGVIGSSRPPYQQWKWFETNSMLGGPNFLILRDNTMLASYRQTVGSQESCILARMTLDSYEPIITFPSSGDGGYPGMVRAG